MKKILAILLVFNLLFCQVFLITPLAESVSYFDNSYTEWSLLGDDYSDKGDATGNISRSFNKCHELPFITKATTFIASENYDFEKLQVREFGICSKKQAATSNMAAWISNPNAEIRFWLKSERNISFDIVMVVGEGNAFANVNVNGADGWQEIKLKSSDFNGIESIYNEISSSVSNDIYLSIIIDRSTFIAGQHIAFGNRFEAYSQSAYSKGDANQNGKIDIKDLVMVKKLTVDNASNFINCDIDADGKLTATDVTYFRKWMLFGKWNDKSMEKTYKVLFIGNSFTYYGRAVQDGNRKNLKLSTRQNDSGFFAQLCKENGMNVEVTNWTWPTHTLSDIFGGYCTDEKCQVGIDHLSYLTDRNYDYVIIQEGSAIVDNLDYVYNVRNIFKEFNPYTEFIVIEQSRAHFNDFARLKQLKVLAQDGFEIVDWGDLVVDIVKGDASVENAKMQYNQNSFIVSKSATDGYHPNMLSGYITSLMTYCVITGEKAEGQPYSFCGDTTKNSLFNFDAYYKKYYSYSPSNFIDIFNSDDDMRGIQRLIDRYLSEKPYMYF